MIYLSVLIPDWLLYQQIGSIQDRCMHGRLLLYRFWEVPNGEVYRIGDFSSRELSKLGLVSRNQDR